MDFEPNYGSSEYSNQAEELFARFLLDAENGVYREFEEFCAEHEAYADELYGLHADWDNVRGLLAQMKGQRVGSEPQAPHAAPSLGADEVLQREARSDPFSAKDVPDAEAPVHQRAWKVMTSGAVLVAAIAGLWAFQLHRSGEVLAREKKSLQTTGESTRQQLSSVRAAKGDVEAERDHIQLTLKQEQTEKRELEAERLQLDQALALERTRSEAASREAAGARTRALQFAALAQAGELVKREEDLWPSSRSQLVPIEAWLTDADQLVSTWSSLTPEEGVVAPTSRELEFLLGSGGLVDATRERLQIMRRWDGDMDPGTNSAWGDAITLIQDPTRAPQYAGLKLAPQFGLAPLGLSEETGLFRFADLQVPWADGRQSAPAGTEADALVLVLVPGLEIEGHSLPPFLVCEREWVTGKTPSTTSAGRPPEGLPPNIRHELDLVRMGYLPLSSMQASMARQYGLKVSVWKRFPVRTLSTE